MWLGRNIAAKSAGETSNFRTKTSDMDWFGIALRGATAALNLQPNLGMAKTMRPARSKWLTWVCACLAYLAGSSFFIPPVQAAEYGIGDYLLGYSLPMAGYTPPRMAARGTMLAPSGGAWRPLGHWSAIR
jgi:hypothetical protein